MTASPSSSVDEPPAVAPLAPRRRRPLPLAVLALALVLVAGWQVAGRWPALEDGGATWHSGSFTPESEGMLDSDRQPAWVVWDDDAGGWASVLVRNARPFPVTLVPGRTSPWVEVRVAQAVGYPRVVDIDPGHLPVLDRVTVPAGGYAVVAARVSSRCLDMGSETFYFTDVAVVEVTALGVTTTTEAPLGGRFSTATTKGHSPDPTCGELWPDGRP